MANYETHVVFFVYVLYDHSKYLAEESGVRGAVGVTSISPSLVLFSANPFSW